MHVCWEFFLSGCLLSSVRDSFFCLLFCLASPPFVETETAVLLFVVFPIQYGCHATYIFRLHSSLWQQEGNVDQKQ